MPMTFLWMLLTMMTVTPQAPNRGAVLPASALGRAGWLVGCWHASGDIAADSRETWMAASERVLVGRSWRAAPGGVAEYSFLRIESADGALSLVIQAPGKRLERLPLDPASSADELKFANESKQIVYRRGKKETLAIRTAIEGAKPLDVPMAKGNCPSRDR